MERGDGAVADEAWTLDRLPVDLPLFHSPVVFDETVCSKNKFACGFCESIVKWRPPTCRSGRRRRECWFRVRKSGSSLGWPPRARVLTGRHC